MVGYVFVGRRRHPLKLLLYQLLTLGVYGRVWLYKLLREFDGHEALFLDRRPYIGLLVLPIIGPLFVKRRVLLLFEDIAHHDPTTPRFSPRGLFALAFIPLAPLFHMRLQRLLNHHWGMHVKEEELEIKQAELAALRRSRTTESVKHAQALEREITIRSKELEDLKKASIALREAEDLRRHARVPRPGPLALVRKLGSLAAARLPRGASSTASTDAEEEAAPAKPRGRAKEEPAADEAAAEPEPEPPEPRRGKKPPAEAEPAGEPPAATTGPRRWTATLPFIGSAARGDRDARRRAKEERKEAARREKEKRKAEKAARKEKAADDKAKEKERRRAEKEAAKSAKSSSGKKSKPDKKEKGGAGAEKKKAAGKGKGRSR